MRNVGYLLILSSILLIFPFSAICQWYTDPHNPVPVYGPVSESGGLMADLNGGAYFFIYAAYENAAMSHVNLDGLWSCPLPGVVIGPAYSGWYHVETLDPDNNLIVHGTYGSPFPPEVPSELYKFSATGAPLWQTFIFPDTLTQPTYMVSDGSGGCLIAITIGTGEGLHWYIQHFDASGHPQFGWTERPLSGTGQLSSASLISDGTGGGFALWKIVQDSAHTVRMQHIRSDGSFAYADSGIIIIEDAYYYYAGMDEYPSCAGSFIVKWGTVQPPREYHCTRFDSTGTVIWDRTDFNYPSSDLNYIISDCLGGLYLFYEDTTYSRLNTTGDVVFTGRSLAPWSQFAYGEAVSSSGELSALHWNQANEVWTLQKYDSLGTQVWTEAVPVLYNMPSAYGEGLVADTRGGVILFFSRQSGTYFTRVDAYGQVGSSVHVNPIVLAPINFELSAFPNPFNSQINLTWTTNIGGAIRLNITNLLGQQVLSVEIPANATRYIWDGCDAWGTPVSSGVYYVTLQTKQIKQSLRIVLIK
jgi:hypothetical protein